MKTEPKPRLDEEQRRTLIARKKLHVALEGHIRERGGALESVPGDTVMRFTCSPGSGLPDELRGLGYELTPCGTTMRIVPHAVEGRLTATSSGGLEPFTEGSTKPVIIRATHAGIQTHCLYDLTLPPGAKPK
ncbi:MAG TPA: hypothetical protein VIY51_20695 [Xanthobacteraceae bacterium]